MDEDAGGLKANIAAVDQVLTGSAPAASSCALYCSREQTAVGWQAVGISVTNYSMRRAPLLFSRITLGCGFLVEALVSVALKHET